MDVGPALEDAGEVLRRHVPGAAEHAERVRVFAGEKDCGETASLARVRLVHGDPGVSEFVAGSPVGVERDAPGVEPEPARGNELKVDPVSRVARHLHRDPHLAALGQGRDDELDRAHDPRPIGPRRGVAAERHHGRGFVAQVRRVRDQGQVLPDPVPCAGAHVATPDLEVARARATGSLPARADRWSMPTMRRLSSA